MKKIIINLFHISASALFFNFNAAGQSYGNNMVQVDDSPFMRFAIYSGDVNQDGIVNIVDNQLIDNDIYNFTRGYVRTDLNGDNIVDLADASIVYNNAFNFVIKVTP
ncbi:MAG: hypothetical protein ABI840_07700 [bacterium]